MNLAVSPGGSARETTDEPMLPSVAPMPSMMVMSANESSPSLTSRENITPEEMITFSDETS